MSALKPSMSRRGVRAVACVVLTLVASLTAAVTTTTTAAAATGSGSNLQLRSIVGNCLTADGHAEGAFVTMQRCDSGDSRQRWDVALPASDVVAGGQLRLAGTSLCLGSYVNSTLNGAKAVLRACVDEGNPSIRWVTSDLGSRLQPQIRAQISGKCLDVAFAGTAPGTPAQLWDCNATPAQQWLVGAPGYTGPVVGVGGNCLTASTSLPAESDVPAMFACTGSARQAWTMVDGYLWLGNRCLDIRGADLAEGTPVQLWTCVDVPQQHWAEQSSGVLKSALGDVCLDVDSAGTAPGTRVWSWSCNFTYAQGWYHGDLPTRLVDTEALATKLNVAIDRRVGECSGMISYDADNIAVVAMRNPAPFVVERPPNRTFTSVARSAAAGWTNRAAMNGQWFIPDAGAPFGLQPQGDIWRSGELVNSNPFPDNYQGFYLTADQTGACPAHWSIGPQSNDLLGAAPPNPSNFAMGGARPLLINGQKWGTTEEPLLHWPSPAVGKTFDQYNDTAEGKPTVGVRGDGVVLFMVQRSRAGLNIDTGRHLTEIRDAYQLLGFDDAVMWDGGTSATLTVNGRVRVAPGGVGSFPLNPAKNRLIPAGFGMASRA